MSEKRSESKLEVVAWWQSVAWSGFPVQPFEQALRRARAAIRGMIMADGRGEIEYFRRPGGSKRTKKDLAEKVRIHQANLESTTDELIQFEIAKELGLPPAIFVPGDLQLIAAAIRSLGRMVWDCRHPQRMKLRLDLVRMLGTCSRNAEMRWIVDERDSFAYAAYVMRLNGHPLSAHISRGDLESLYSELRTTTTVQCVFSDTQTTMFKEAGFEVMDEQQAFPSLPLMEQGLRDALRIVDEIMNHLMAEKNRK